MDNLVSSATSNEVDVKKVLHSFVVDVSQNSYNKGNIIFKYLFLMRVMVCFCLIQGKCLRQSMQLIFLL